MDSKGVFFEKGVVKEIVRLRETNAALLEALEMAADLIERLPHSWGAGVVELPRIRAAIAQAKGEQS